MISLDYTVFIQIFSFLIFWFLLYKLVFIPFRGLIEERERRTEGVKAEVESLIEEGERLRNQYEEQISQTRVRGSSLKEAILNECLQEREQILSQAQEDAAKHLQSVQDEIRREIQATQSAAEIESEAIARQITEKILGRKVG